MSLSLTRINSYSNIIISRQEVKYVQEIFTKHGKHLILLVNSSITV